MRRFLGEVIARTGAVPKHLITDRGRQFDCKGFKRWCRSHDIRQRFGAVGQRGSIAVVERLIGTLKRECSRLLPVVPLWRRSFHRELDLFITWHNAHRPHSTLAGATPDEVYFGKRPLCSLPRFETRAAWPRASPCAAPRGLVKGQPGVALNIKIDFVAHRRHLPVVTLTRAA
jgi:hypothetical protein